MDKTMRRFFVAMFAVALVACGHSSTPLPLVDAGSGTQGHGTQNLAARPKTIPALREWTPASGVFHLTPASRIVVGSNNATLLADAVTFAEDLQTFTGLTLAVVQGAMRAGDIGLDLRANDAQLGSEGYAMSIGNSIAISANQPAGAFYGTRTLLQLLHQNAEIPAGSVRDWPRYPERGLAIDDGNDFYSARWIEAHLRELAYLKMNIFHMHFSDSGGFRIESATHPEIVSADHLSKQELRDIIALASRYHITVIPEIDMPGHMGSVATAHPELQLKNAAGLPAMGLTGSPDKLDITLPAAQQFVRELMEEFLPLFPGPYWVIGGDEYLPAAEEPLFPQLQSYAQAQYGANANTKDALLGFFNWADGIVHAHGKTAHLYNDELDGGSAVSANTDIIIEWWTDISPLSDTLTAKVQTLLDQGHSIMNIGSDPTYYNGGNLGLIVPTSNPQAAYEQWEVNQFAGATFLPPVGSTTVRLPPEVIDPDEPRNLGSKVFVWGGGEGEASITGKIYPRLRVMAQKTWNSPLLVPAYADFQKIIDTIGHAPGYAIQ